MEPCINIPTKHDDTIMHTKFVFLIPLLLMVLGCAQLMDNPKNLSVDHAPEVARKPPVPQDSAVTEDSAAIQGPATSPEDLLAQLDTQGQEFNSRLRDILDKTTHEGVSVTTRPAKNAAQGKVEELSIDFFEADVQDVIRLFMEVLEENYIMHAGVGGKLTLHLKDEFRRDQLLDLLLGVLRIHGVAMLRNTEGLLEFLPLSEAPKMLTADQLILPEEQVRPTRGQIIQGFRLRFAAASELIKVIEPHLSNGSLVYANDPLGIMLICDYPHSLSKVEKLIGLFDVSIFADLKIQVYPLKFVLAKDLAGELQQVAEATGLLNTNGREAISFLPLERLNILCALSKDQQTLAFAEAWIRELDREIPLVVREEQEESIYVYYVQNGDATEIVTALQGVFSEQTREQKDQEEKEGAPIGQQLRDAKAPAQPSAPEAPQKAADLGVVSGKLSGG